MPTVTWNRRYATRIGVPSDEPDKPATTVRLTPGSNELDDATFARLQKAQSFERLTKDGALTTGAGRRAEREDTRALTTQTVGELRTTLGVKPWDPNMSRRDLAEALEARGVQADAMTKSQLIEALRAYDEDRKG